MQINPLLEYLIWLAICVCSIFTVVLIIICLVKLVKCLREVIDVPFTFDQELKQAMLPLGLFMICGRQRAGKTALGCAIMDTDATYHMAERMQLAQQFVNNMNELEQDDPYDLKLPDTIYYSKNNMYLTPDYIDTNHVDVLQVALPETADDAHFPPLSLIHLEEIDAVLNGRTWKDGAQKKANVVDGYKWLGHNDMTVIGDAQVFGRLDAAVRALTTDIFYILRRKDYTLGDEPHHWWQFSHRNDDKIVRTEWDFIWIKNQMHQEANIINQYGNFIKNDKFVRKCKFVYEGNIYERYNPKSGQAYWYKNIRNFHSAPHPSTSLTRTAVDDYCARNARRAENATDETEK